MDDLALLQAYAREGSEDAFAALVERHLNLVYATALRQVRLPQQAEEVAQSVFLSLARNASRLKPDTILAAWLYRVTRHAAIDLLRGESRRQIRDQAAFEMAKMKSDTSEQDRIEPLLDEALEALAEKDRSAILLRYFEQKSLREVGSALGTSEDAARKRVDRAVDELRKVFSRRGLAVGAAGIIVVLTAQSASTAPVGLGAAITASALTSGAAQEAAAIGTTKAIIMTLAQKTLITAALAAAVGAGVFGVRQNARLREQALIFRQSQDALAAQNRQLQHERDVAAAKTAALQAERDRQPGDQAELLRLRGEVGRLRDAARELAQLKSSNGDPMAAEMQSWLDRVKQLKEKIELAPNWKTPEFQYLTDQDWLDAARRLKSVDSDADFRSAVRALQSAAKSEFASVVQAALNQYAQANPGQKPSDFSQVTPYFASPVDDSVLQNYRFSEPGVVANQSGFQVDPDGSYSTSEMQIRTNGISIGSNSGDELKQAIGAYIAANSGQNPTDPVQLLPFVQTPAEKSALQQLLANTSNK